MTGNGGLQSIFSLFDFIKLPLSQSQTRGSYNSNSQAEIRQESCFHRSGNRLECYWYKYPKAGVHFGKVWIKKWSPSLLIILITSYYYRNVLVWTNLPSCTLVFWMGLLKTRDCKCYLMFMSWSFLALNPLNIKSPYYKASKLVKVTIATPFPWMLENVFLKFKKYPAKWAVLSLVLRRNSKLLPRFSYFHSISTYLTNYH